VIVVCWCSHGRDVHGQGGCRLCLGSPYSQAAHEFRSVETMRPLARLFMDARPVMTNAIAGQQTGRGVR
jgi:hypothetical protein